MYSMIRGPGWHYGSTGSATVPVQYIQYIIQLYRVGYDSYSTYPGLYCTWTYGIIQYAFWMALFVVLGPSRLAVGSDGSLSRWAV